MSFALTDTQRAELLAFRKDWINTAVSVSDLDVERVQEGVALTYMLAGLPPPDRLVWLDSPLAGAVAASIFDRCYENLYTRLVSQPVERLQRDFNAKSREEGSFEYWSHVERAMKSDPLNLDRDLVSPIRTQIATQLDIRFGPRGGFDGRQVFSEEVWAYIFTRLEQQFVDRDFEELSRLNLDGNFARSVASASWYCGLGGMDAESIELLDYAHESGEENRAFLRPLKGIFSLSRHSSWWWVFDKVAIVTYRPHSLMRDREGRLHNDSGPAILWLDGWTIHARHGTFVPPRVAEFARRKDIREIESEQNVEIRRHLIEVYGVEQYLVDAEAVKIDEDECGILYRKDFIGDDPLLMVKVLNSTPEPDGTRKWYYLRVPPTVKTAREAVAWTFGMAPDEYAPEVET